MRAGFLIMFSLLLALGVSCDFDIMKERTLEFVIPCEVCFEFTQNESSANFSRMVEIQFANRIDEELEENDISKEDVESIQVVSVSYEVKTVENGSWTITGEAEVMRADAGGEWKKILNYTEVSLLDAMDEVNYADLNQDGIEVVNQAAADYLGGSSPLLRFRIINGDVEPDPSPENRLIFAWEFCVHLHVVVSKDIEVPDPF